MLSIVMLSLTAWFISFSITFMSDVTVVILSVCYAEFHYAERCYAECDFAECYGALKCLMI